MDVLTTIEEVRNRVAANRRQGRKIGCVPTMGALHPGHLSLVESCRKLVDDTVLTIFVNPTQFAPSEDLNKYPRPIEADLKSCEAAGVDFVYRPEVTALYPIGYDTWVSVDELSKRLEGEFRPTHFLGVTTIVAKLFNIVQPDVACFGAKDYQQQTLIRRMVQDLNMPVEVVVCPTIREPDGLAMSSRNIYLSSEERKAALSLIQSLRLAEQMCRGSLPNIAEVELAMHSSLSSTPGVTVQYACIRDPNSLEPLAHPQAEMIALVAAIVGQTRLIDNLKIHLA